MKKDIHPKLRKVVFRDLSIYKANSQSDELAEGEFIIASTASSKDTITIGGKVYPLVKTEVSNLSHPYYTGTQKIVDTAGRVEKFKQRFGKFSREKSTD